MSVLSEPVISGSVLWALGGRAGLRDMSAPPWLPNIKHVPNNNARCTTRLHKPKSPIKGFAWQACQYSGRRAGGALGGLG
eukprot:1153475-Pelagomonas_calceolata.AAC.6